MRPEQLNEIKGLAIFSLALILFFSLFSYTPEDLSWFTTHPNIPVHNWIGSFGSLISGSLFFLFGYSAYFFTVFLFFWSWNIFTSRLMAFSVGRVFTLFLLISVMSGLLSLTGSSMTANRFARGGLMGLGLSDFLVNYFRVAGAYILLLILMCLCLVLVGDFLVSPLLVRATRWFMDKARELKEKGLLAFFPVMQKAPADVKPGRPAKKAFDEDEMEEDDVSVPVPVKGKGKKPEPEVKPVAVKPPEPPKPPKITIIQKQEETKESKEREDKIAVVGNYQLPPFDLLQDAPKISEDNVQGALVSGAKMLEETLASFGVSARVADIERGPVITKYELEPAVGVRVQSISALSNDLALAMQASSIRIQAPIPGKNRVGIEVPNGASAAVFLKDVMLEGRLRETKSRLTMALGQDTSGKPILADLAAMPHLLVAGSTGSGKSVCLNAIIMSLLYNASPSELKFIMVDPKMVELNQYNDLPHMLCPAITDHKKVVSALGWVVSEMESRYKLLAKNQVRNIAAYHAKGFEMPYIVIIIDEFADLMQTSGKVVESAVVRLAQLARAVGIHLILATQRPSVNVITGVIKANLPARIAFRVNSQVDSRTILDEKGADDLLGRGDMLFMKPGDPKPTRGQCSYLSDEEIHKVVSFIKTQEKPKYDDTVTAKPVAMGGADDEKDELFPDAVRMVMETNQASTSMLQRRMGLGYSRAARIIDQMERAGILGASQGSKPREILIDREKWLLDNMGKQVQAEEEAQDHERTD